MALKGWLACGSPLRCRRVRLRNVEVMRDEQIEWLSTARTASYLGLQVRTLYRLIDEGQLPGYRFGRVIRLQRADVDAFIAASRIEPGELAHLYPEVRDVDV
ncbi:MAG: excisionase family DNA-binding protein [Actinomycetota bacterium]